jgi:hypothetical protein
MFLVFLKSKIKSLRATSSMSNYSLWCLKVNSFSGLNKTYKNLNVSIIFAKINIGIPNIINNIKPHIFNILFSLTEIII